MKRYVTVHRDYFIGTNFELCNFSIIKVLEGNTIQWVSALKGLMNVGLFNRPFVPPRIQTLS
jgi:hypothetical protein